MTRTRALLVLALAAGLAACSSSQLAQQPAPSVTASPSVSPSAAATPVGRALLLGVIGDFGKRGGQAPTMVRVLRDYARVHGLDGRLAAVVTTGDNAYEQGTVEQVAFARGLLDPLLGGGTRLVASLGNHDEATRGGAPARAGFAMPARWYTTTVGPVQLVVLDANRPKDADQLRWLRDVLAAPRPVRYRVAVFHQPAAACSLHPADRDVDRVWLPLLDRAVDLVLSGHNHTYERFVDAAGLPLVTTGGGGATIYPSTRALCTGPATAKVLRSTYNVVVLAVGTDRLHLTALDRHGGTLDTVDLAPRG